MGYTHYWRREQTLPKKQWNAFVEDVQTLLVRLPKHSLSAGGYSKDAPLVIAGPLGTGDPIIGPDVVSFNGSEEVRDDDGSDLSHETFYLARVFEPEEWESPESGKYFAFCKTAQKPYDLLVCACLLSFKHHFPTSVVSSDGGPSDWSIPLIWYTDVFNRKVAPGPWTPRVKDKEAS